MSKYICIGCGHIIDLDVGVEAKEIAPNMNSLLQTGCGWHKSTTERPKVLGIAPGTNWNDVPEEFVCPSCRNPKSYFEDAD